MPEAILVEPDQLETWCGGLQVSWVSATSVRVAAGSIYIPGLGRILKFPSDVTVNLTGLTANAWIYLYAYDNAGVPSIEFSVVTPAKYRGTSAAWQKTADPTRRYVPNSALLVNPSGTAILKFENDGNEREWLEGIGNAPLPLLSGGTAVASTPVSAAGVVPPTSHKLMVELFSLYAAGSLNYCYIGYGNLNGVLTSNNYSYILYPNNSNEMRILLTAARAFNYMQTNAGAALYIFAKGYFEEG